MELWSLMHFLMPHVFQSHREFKEWFSNPLTGMIEGSQEYNESLVKRLHKVRGWGKLPRLPSCSRVGENLGIRAPRHSSSPLPGPTWRIQASGLSVSGSPICYSLLISGLGIGFGCPGSQPHSSPK